MHPRRLNELKPVRTIEVEPTDTDPQFVMRPVYDNARRTPNRQIIIRALADDPNWGESGGVSSDKVPGDTADVSGMADPVALVLLFLVTV